MAKNENATIDNDIYMEQEMSSEAKKALEKIQKMRRELAMHRHPVSENREAIPVNGMQLGNDNSYKLENGTYENVEIGARDGKIKAVEYDKRREKDGLEREEK